MVVPKREPQINNFSNKAKYAELGVALLVIILAVLVFLDIIPKLSSITVPTSSSGITVTSSFNYNYLFALNYVFVGIDIVVGLTIFLFGILSVIALYRHRSDNAPITVMILNLNRSSNPFVLLILSAILILIAVIAFFVSIISSYSIISFLSGVILGTAAFILVAISLLNLSLKYLVRFIFRYE